MFSNKSREEYLDYKKRVKARKGRSKPPITAIMLSTIPKWSEDEEGAMFSCRHCGDIVRMNWQDVKPWTSVSHGEAICDECQEGMNSYLDEVVQDD